MHFIATRMGLGMSHASSFRRRSGLLLHTLFPGMAAQTKTDFQWVVFTDSRIDPESEAAVAEAFAPYPHFHLEKHNVFESADMSLPLGIAAQRLFGTTKGHIYTRIDDDDALAIDFVERAQAALQGTEGPVVLSFRRGLKLLPRADHLGRTLSSAPSAGITFRVPDLARRHSFHRASHRKVHERVAAAGGTSLILDTDQPMRLSVIHDFSDSHEREGKRPAPTRRGIGKRAALLARFALPPDISATLNRIVDETPDERAALANTRMKRLGLKSTLLALAQEVRSQIEGADEHRRPKLERQLEALNAAFHAF